MSRFFSAKYKNVNPYNTAGDKVPNKNCIRLNTNESPYPPSPLAIKWASDAAKGLNFYSDPECHALAEKIADLLSVKPSEVLFGNGSDEILNFIFMSFCDNGAVFPNITYSFYKTLAGLNKVDYELVPLKNFRIDPDDYYSVNGRTVFIANPNAPTGLALALNEIENIVSHNRNSIVVIDEAYVDFGTASSVSLIHEYDNLLVTRTFSKSRSLAGARLGFCIGCEDLIKDLRDVKNSMAPYNINSMTQAAGLGSLEDKDYTREKINLICETREKTKKELEKLGFDVLDSVTNFLFAKHKELSGKKVYLELQKRDILIRHFDNPSEISEYNRITVGTPEQMRTMILVLSEVIRNAQR